MKKDPKDSALAAHVRRILNRNSAALDAARTKGKRRTWDALYLNLAVKPAELAALFKFAGISPDLEKE